MGHLTHVRQDENVISTVGDSNPQSLPVAQHNESNEYHTKGQSAPPYSEKLPDKQGRGPLGNEQLHQNPSQHENPMLPPTIPLNALGDEPAWIVCPFCEYRVRTRVVGESSDKTQQCGIILCLLVGILGAFLPCICGWFEDVTHFCDNCGKKVVFKPYEGKIQVFDNVKKTTVDNTGKAMPDPEVVLSEKTRGGDMNIVNDTGKTVHEEVTHEKKV